MPVGLIRLVNTLKECALISLIPKVTRKRISWLGATLLSLYHLHITEAPSNLGFYHWRTDVARLIATHWSDIFGPAVKKKKTWQVSFFSCFLLNLPLIRVLSLDLCLEMHPHYLSLVSAQLVSKGSKGTDVLVKTDSNNPR